MVFEAVVQLERLKSQPLIMVPISAAVTLVSIYLSVFIFPEYAGIVFPLLISVALAPIFHDVLTDEEMMERASSARRKGILFRHKESLALFSSMFVGVLLGVLAVLFVSPIDGLLSPQADSIVNVKQITGSFIFSTAFVPILINNLKVVFFAFILSLFMGVGALWIFSWNASVLALYIFELLKNGSSLAVLAILPHAALEITAYFLAGIAGGILSVDIMREKIGSRDFIYVLKDAVALTVLAVALLSVAAGIEVL